jgi:ABC-type lipoprotein release transport system permease subunit
MRGRETLAIFVGGVTLVLALTLAASWFPARRAMAVDPVVALCQE